MRKLRLAVAVGVVAAFSVLASSSAQAYPGVTVNVSEATVVGGNEIEITATVDPSSIDCEWELTFLGDTHTGSGNSITETFSTPEVDSVEQHEAVATCTFDNGVPAAMGGGRSLGTSLVQAEVSSTGSGTQTLLPLDDDDGDGDGDGDGDDGGLLPNTGGERLAWLLIGALLVLIGGGVVVASRRRDA